MTFLHRHDPRQSQPTWHRFHHRLQQHRCQTSHHSFWPTWGYTTIAGGGNRHHCYAMTISGNGDEDHVLTSHMDAILADARMNLEHLLRGKRDEDPLHQARYSPSNGSHNLSYSRSEQFLLKLMVSDWLECKIKCQMRSIPEPDGHGWEREDGCLTTKWTWCGIDASGISWYSDWTTDQDGQDHSNIIMSYRICIKWSLRRMRKMMRRRKGRIRTRRRSVSEPGVWHRMNVN